MQDTQSLPTVTRGTDRQTRSNSSKYHQTILTAILMGRQAEVKDKRCILMGFSFICDILLSTILSPITSLIIPTRKNCYDVHILYSCS